MDQIRTISFEKSESLKEFGTALAKAQAVMETAVKDRENPFFKSKYADLASVWDVCRKALTGNGISVVQMPCGGEPGRIAVSTMLLHQSGEWIASTCSIRVVKDDPQGVGSAITYLRRYMLSAMAGVVADVDDDANAASAARPQPVNRIRERILPTPPAAMIRKIEGEQAENLRARLDEAHADSARFCDYFGIGHVEELPIDRFDEAMQMLSRRIAQAKPAEAAEKTLKNGSRRRAG